MRRKPLHVLSLVWVRLIPLSAADRSLGWQHCGSKRSRRSPFYAGRLVDDDRCHQGVLRK